LTDDEDDPTDRSSSIGRCFVNFIRCFLIIFIILFQVSYEKEVYATEAEKTPILKLPDEILREIVLYAPYPFEIIENLKLVSKYFYDFVYREFFGIIDCLSFKENLNFKRMLLVFLNQEDQDRVSKIEKFEFIVQSFADDFKQAMLKTLQSHPKANLFFENPILIQKLNKQIERPIVKDILSVCHQYGLGVKQDENEAKKLEKEMISDLLSSYQLIPAWEVQILMDPVFVEWFQKLGILKRLKWAQDYLKYPSYAYAKIEYIKNWIQSERVQKEVSEFIENKALYDFYSKLQVCECYLYLLHSLIKQLNLHRDQFHSVTFIRNWLTSKSTQSDVLSNLNVRRRTLLERSTLTDSSKFLFLELTKITVLYLKLLELFRVQKNDDFLKKVKTCFLEEFLKYFSLKNEHFFLKKFVVVQFFSHLEKYFINQFYLKKYCQDWLVKNKERIKRKMSEDLSQLQNFFEEWKNYCSLAVSCIQEKQGLEEVGMNCIQAFFRPETELDIFLQIEMAAYLIKKFPSAQVIQCIKNWLNLEKTQRHFKKWFNQCNLEQISVSMKEDYQCIQFIEFISKMHWLIQMGYFERINRFSLYFLN